jgi:hypothetical protein
MSRVDQIRRDLAAGVEEQAPTQDDAEQWLVAP